MTSTQLTIVIYDIGDDRRRGRVHRLLKQYGVRVQASAFEARLTLREREQLARALNKLLEADEDHCVVYTIGRDQEAHIRSLAGARPVVQTPGFFIV